jgi:hypothetical protein
VMRFDPNTANPGLHGGVLSITTEEVLVNFETMPGANPEFLRIDPFLNTGVPTSSGSAQFTAEVTISADCGGSGIYCERFLITTFQGTGSAAKKPIFYSGVASDMETYLQLTDNRVIEFAWINWGTTTGHGYPQHCIMKADIIFFKPPSA